MNVVRRPTHLKKRKRERRKKEKSVGIRLSNNSNAALIEKVYYNIINAVTWLDLAG